MTDLLTLLREHDLPPYWDGLATAWDPWDTNPDTPTIFICPPPKKDATCDDCGSTAIQHQTKGLVARATFIDHDRIAYEEANRLRLGRAAHKRKPVAAYRLWVWRCPDCRLDTVWDVDEDRWFVLEHDDYGPDGAVGP